MASYDIDVTVVAIMLQAENVANDQHSHADQQSLDPFFREVLPGAIGSMDIATVIHRSLLRGHALGATGYKQALDVISRLVGFCPVTDGVHDQNMGRIAHAMAAAIRHYECHGCATTNSDEKTVVELAPHFIRTYM